MTTPDKDALRDPVCGMIIKPESPQRYTYKGQDFAFCGPRCLELFQNQPERYLGPGIEKPEKAEVPAIAEGEGGPEAYLTCAMHPEVKEPLPRGPKCGRCFSKCRRNGRRSLLWRKRRRRSRPGRFIPAPWTRRVRQEKPGTCPKCGMALERAEPEAPLTHTEWTCPMHPEVVQDSPGTCPKCGMALEPRTVYAEEEENPELVSMRRRFWVSVVLTIPLVAIAMGGMAPGFQPFLERMASPRAWGWVELALATPVVLWGGWPFFVRGAKSIINRSLNMFTLIGLGVSVAYLYSVIAQLFPGIFPASFRSETGEVAVYFEAAAFIVTLVLLGQVLELKARGQTSAAIKALLGLAPKTARRLKEDGTEEDVPLEQVRVGDRLRVRPGEKVPVDGTVLEGKAPWMSPWSPANRSRWRKSPATRSSAATVNGTGSLVMRAERVGTETLAGADRPDGRPKPSAAARPIQKLADVVAGYFVPRWWRIAVITFIVWALVGPEPRMAHAIVNAVAVLIIACPCALGLATPMSIMVATGQGRRLGVLFKNAEAIEVMRKVDTLVVDKTGTLTEGKPKLVSVTSRMDDDGEQTAAPGRDAWNMAASIRWPRPSSRARRSGDQAERRRAISVLTGKGVKGLVEGRQRGAGQCTAAGRIGHSIRELVRTGGVTAPGRPDGDVGGRGGKARGSCSAVADPVKETTPAAIRQLHADGIRIVMLTGDNRTTAEAVARKLRHRRSRYAEVLPQNRRPKR